MSSNQSIKVLCAAAAIALSSTIGAGVASAAPASFSGWSSGAAIYNAQLNSAGTAPDTIVNKVRAGHRCTSNGVFYVGPWATLGLISQTNACGPQGDYNRGVQTSA